MFIYWVKYELFMQLKEYVRYLSIVVFFAVALLFIATLAVHWEYMFGEYTDACWELKQQTNNMSLKDCVDYLNENPRSTGQQVLDYFESSDERLLDEPILPDR